MCKGIIIVAVGTLTHLLLSAGLFVTTAGLSLNRLDVGGAASSAERALSAVMTVLLYPLFVPAVRLLPSLTGAGSYVVLLANSFLWGLAGYLVLRTVHRQRGREVRV